MEPKEVAAWAFSKMCDSCQEGEYPTHSACANAKRIHDWLLMAKKGAKGWTIPQDPEPFYMAKKQS